MAGKPELGNSKVRITHAIGIENHVQASAWLNISDNSLREALLNYLQSSGDKPNCRLRIRSGVPGNWHYTDCISFNLFVNNDNHPAPAAVGVAPDPQAPPQAGAGLYAKVGTQ